DVVDADGLAAEIALLPGAAAGPETDGTRCGCAVARGSVHLLRVASHGSILAANGRDTPHALAPKLVMLGCWSGIRLIQFAATDSKGRAGQASARELHAEWRE